MRGEREKREGSTKGVGGDREEFARTRTSRKESVSMRLSSPVARAVHMLVERLVEAQLSKEIEVGRMVSFQGTVLTQMSAWSGQYTKGRGE